MLCAPAEPSEQRTPAVYELTWTAPTGCPTEEQLRESIAELVPDPSGGEGVMFVDATVVQLPQRFSVRIVTDFAGHVDERTVESATCTDLGDATALVVAVALKPRLVGPGPPESPHAVPSPPLRREPKRPPDAVQPETVRLPATVEQDRQPRSVSSTAIRRPQRWPAPGQALLRIAPLLEYGTLPSGGGGAALSAGLLWRRWRAELFGLYLFPQRQTFDRTRSLLQLGAAGGRACHRLFAGRVEFPICLGIEAGALRAQTRGQRPGTTLNLVWLAPSARAGMAVGGRRVGFFAAGELAFSTLIPGILVGDETVFESRVVSVRAFAGLEIFFAIDRR